ncbi:MAG: M20 family metallopeptidase, partial [Traorella sp.]
MNILEEAISIKEEIISYRRQIHQHPETGDVLPTTKKFVLEKLKEFGYEPQEICESGIVALLNGKFEGKTLLLRADMDALLIEEQTNLDFKSTNGCMHACGHDMHTAMLLGAAKLLKNHQDEIHGTVKFVFQPNEEGFLGAKRMIQAGVLENPHVDGAIAMHVNSGTPSKLILCPLKTPMAGCIRFRIVVKGKGCHGAMVENGVDPINIAAHLYLALQTIKERELNPNNPTVISIGKFVGGESANIIPNEVIMEGTVRYFVKEDGEYIATRMKEMTQQICTMMKGEGEYIELSSVPPLKINTAFMKEMVESLKEIVDENSLYEFEDGGMGSEDFASYSHQVPTAFYMIGAG